MYVITTKRRIENPAQMPIYRERAKDYGKHDNLWFIVHPSSHTTRHLTLQLGPYRDAVLVCGRKKCQFINTIAAKHNRVCVNKGDIATPDLDKIE